MTAKGFRLWRSFFTLPLFQVREQAKNQNGHVDGQRKSFVHRHLVLPPASSIPAEAGRVSGDNRRKESGPSSGSSIAWSACAVKGGWRALGGVLRDGAWHEELDGIRGVCRGTRGLARAKRLSGLGGAASGPLLHLTAGSVAFLPTGSGRPTLGHR